LRQAHKLYGAFRTCYSNKILFLQDKLHDIDRRVDVAVMMVTTVRTDPLSLYEPKIPPRTPVFQTVPLVGDHFMASNKSPYCFLPILRLFHPAR